MHARDRVNNAEGELDLQHAVALSAPNSPCWCGFRPDDRSLRNRRLFKIRLRMTGLSTDTAEYKKFRNKL